MVQPFPRSHELVQRDDSAVLVVDVQQRLVPFIQGHARMIRQIVRLLQAARLLAVASAATEQYPQGLGPTVEEIAEFFPAIPSKRMFSCRECAEIFRNWKDQQLSKIMVVGIETHVCVQQTVLDLLGEGFRVYLPVDACGSRHPLDHETALRRMEGFGAILTTTESLMFEWCETAAAAEFKQLSQLVKDD